MRPQLLLPARVLSEAIATCVLVATVVGSGIAAEDVSAGDAGSQMLETSAATALVLVALICAFLRVSGAHFNPAVTVALRLAGRIDTRTAVAYILAQFAGGCLGAVVAHLMFELSPVTVSTTERASGAHAFAELVATFGLLTIIFAVTREGSDADSGTSAHTNTIAMAVAGYIGAASWFTSSTSFANPAVTVARTLTDTLTGIAPASVPAFLGAQLVGAVLAVGVARLLFAEPHPVVPPVR